MKIILSEAEHAEYLTRVAWAKENGCEELGTAIDWVRSQIPGNVVVEIEGAAYREFERRLYGHNAPSAQGASR